MFWKNPSVSYINSFNLLLISRGQQHTQKNQRYNDKITKKRKKEEKNREPSNRISINYHTNIIDTLYLQFNWLLVGNNSQKK